jgi:tetratricopeptide (TPR) repeat protein
MTSSTDEQDASTDSSLGADEAKQHIIYIEIAYKSEDAAERRQALIEGLMRFGIRFAQSINYIAGQTDNQGPFENVKNEVDEILGSWVMGARLTDRVDEDERRAQLAAFLLRSENALLERYAVRCLLALPEGHTQRDTALAHSALLRMLERSRASGETDGQLLAITDLVEFRLEPHERLLEFIHEGRSLAERVSEADTCRSFRISSIGYYVALAIEASDEGRDTERREWAGKAHELFEELRVIQPDDFKTVEGLSFAALIMEMIERPSEAAAMFASAVDSSAPDDERYRRAAVIEARYRMELGEYERVVKILTPAVPVLEEIYLTAVEDAAVAEAGEVFSETTGVLALAHAHLERWDEAVKYLERGKSLRLRYRAALRRSPAGKRLLELETKLYALARGVPVEGGEFDAQQIEDWLGAKVSLRNKVLEAYRKGRPRLSPELLAVPSVADIARTLAPDEAVVTLGVVKRMETLVAVICHGDGEQPSGRFLFGDWPLKRWAQVFAGRQNDGWLYALAAPELQLDYRPALLDVLNRVDEVVGQTLRTFLRGRKVRRVTIIPHSLFHFLPFWALPSLEAYDVVIAASAAHFVQTRHAAEPACGRALVVADPTRDLPASQAEGEAVGRRLARLNFDVTRLDREQATEDALIESLRGVSVFHFCGHGHSDVGNPERSALLVSPKLNGVPEGTSDPLAYYAEAAQDWQKEDDYWRSAVVPGSGRLYEQSAADGQPLERRFEYGERGTLWGRYKNGRLMRLAEMWTAGDILIDSPLADCRLAFLSACEAGSGSIGVGVEEYSGMPAALQLAGVATVVCSLWPVGDELTALYVDLFYEALAKAPQPADVGKVVRKVGRRLRRMKRERAVVLINRLRRQTASTQARFRLEAFAAHIAAGDPYPFEHPYDWAAFYATGTSRVLFRQGDAQ